MATPCYDGCYTGIGHTADCPNRPHAWADIDVLNQIAEGEWEIDADAAKLEGDEGPSWEVTGCINSLSLKRTIGWYEQTGDARWQNIVALARAMDGANEALEVLLRSGDY